jgi:4-amino-4-deoxy-L-arabinose transferase-like glycosyltransferase
MNRLTPRIKLLCLLSILIVAASLRLYRINQPYVDMFGWRQASDAMMASNFYHQDWNILYPQVNWGGPGPNYQGREFQTVTYIAAILYTFLGEHDWIGRCVAVSFGLWGIFALYQVVRRVWGENNALASAAILAVIPGSVFIDRSFLPDPAMVALATTCLWIFLMFCQTERLRYLVFACTLWTLACITKPQGLTIIIPVVYSFAAILGNKALKPKILFPLVLTFLLSLTIIFAYYSWAIHLAQTYPPHHLAGSGKFLWEHGFVAWLQKKYFIPKLYSLIMDFLWTWPITVLVIVGLFLSPPTNMSKRPQWLFHSWVCALPILYVFEAQHLVTDVHNLNIINPIAAAFSGRAVNKIFSILKSTWGTRFAIIGLVGILFMITVIGRYETRWIYRKYYYQNEYTLGMELRKLAQPDDLVVTFGLNPVPIYYSGLYGWVFPPSETWHQPHDDLYKDSQERIRVLDSLRRRGAVWLVLASSSFKGFDKAPLLLNYINTHYVISYKSQAGDIYRLRE